MERDWSKESQQVQAAHANTGPRNETGAPIGRPSKIPITTEDRKQVILNAMRVGLSLTTASRVAGVTRNAVYQWAEKDQEFQEALQQVQAMGIKEVTDALTKQALNGSTKAAIFWLSQRAEEFRNVPTMTEQEVQLMEKIIATMIGQRLLPDPTLISVGLN